MKGTILASIICSLVSIALLVYVLNKEKTKENLCLCDNMGNAIYKHVDYSPYVYNYKTTEFGF